MDLASIGKNKNKNKTCPKQLGSFSSCGANTYKSNKKAMNMAENKEKMSSSWDELGRQAKMWGKMLAKLLLASPILSFYKDSERHYFLYTVHFLYRNYLDHFPSVYLVLLQ